MRLSGLLGIWLAVVWAMAAPPLRADVGSWCPEGQKAFSAGKYEAANVALNGCLYDPPDDPELAAEGYLMRGETYLRSSDFEAALGDFDHAVELAPDNAGAWRSKAWVLYKTNQMHPAVEAITRSLELDDRETKSHHIHALILTALGRELAAMDAYDLAYSFETKAKVQKLQKALASQDYKVGATDGIYGARTREALKQCIADKCVIPL